MTYTRSQLFDILWNIGGPLPSEQNLDLPEAPEMRSFLIRQALHHSNEILATWEPARLAFYYRWYSYKINRSQLIKLIEAHVGENNLPAVEW